MIARTFGIATDIHAMVPFAVGPMYALTEDRRSAGKLK